MSPVFTVAGTVEDLHLIPFCVGNEHHQHHQCDGKSTTFFVMSKSKKGKFFLPLPSKTSIAMQTHRFLIAAPSSGVGKTTATIGLLRALHLRGLLVQAFKSGPDYIDPKFHQLATNQASINLDQYFCESAEIKSLFQYYSTGKDVAVIEGVMGLFDGFDGRRGSSAELAKTLGLPVVLVVNGAAVAHSIAALLYGFKHFDAELQMAGVIFNNVSSGSHYRIMKAAAEEVGIASLGHIPRKSDISVPSRHLGLNIDNRYRITAYADNLAKHVEQYVNIDLLLSVTTTESREVLSHQAVFSNKSNRRVAVAKDEAFNFIYPETIRLFEQFAEVVYFSPLADAAVPEADYVYLPGGYPELYAQQLSKNKPMLSSIANYAAVGGKLWAECGGMIYLCQALKDEQGKQYPLAAVIAATATMENMRLRLGYRQFSYGGTIYKGHEFHYSTLLPNQLHTVVPLFGAKGQKVDTLLIKQKNVVASYVHLYLKNRQQFENLFK